MGSPFDNTPAVKSPSRYAALNMHGEQFTGLWTQANPYRDAAVSYLISKFYGGSRIDRIIDGVNREITQSLTDKRRPGSVLYNSNTFDPINSFYSWKYIQDDAEVVRVLADSADRNIIDITDNGDSVLYAKTVDTPARFLGINTELFIADGTDTAKIVKSNKTWMAATVYEPGDFIVDTNGNIQVAFGAVAASTVSSSIADVAPPAGFPVVSSTVTLQLNPAERRFATGETVTFLGLSLAKILNGQSLIVNDLTGGLISVEIPAQPAYATAADYGEVYSNGDSVLQFTPTSGGTQPAWATGLAQPTLDNTVRWINKGPATQNWGGVAPTVAPTVTQVPTSNPLPRWAADTYYFTQQVVIDPSGTILLQLVTPGTTGASAPTFSPTFGHATADGTAVWQTITAGAGVSSSWTASFAYVAGSNPPSRVTFIVAGTAYVFLCVQSGTSGPTAPPFTATLGVLTNDGDGVVWQNVGPLFNYTAIGGSQAVQTTQAILDVNGYAQDVFLSGISDTTEPAWDESSTGNVTVDNTMSWENGGAVSVVAGAVTQYAYSWASSVTKATTNASPLSVPVLRRADSDVLVQRPGPTDAQFDSVIVWRYAQGQSTLIEVGQVPILGLGMIWSFLDNLPNDTSLIAQIAAPIDEQNDPPPSNITAMAFHLQRLWGIVDNTVVYSGGPDTLVGAPYETFPPDNEIPYPAQPIFLMPVTVQGGGILVFTTSGVYIILGTGTANDPFYTTIYYASVNLLGYNAIDVYNTAVYLMEANGKVSTLAIEYPFNPQSGYTEIGFPIGDQFKKVTTAGINASIYDPATAYLCWNIQSSAETAMFVADGENGWFNMQNINPPESGILWNPFAAIVGGTSAVQSIETSPGVHNLLMGPATSGPILMRDTTGTVFTDNGAAYPAWDIKGVMTLCSTGEWCEVAHVSTKSVAVGARPQISTLMGEIRPTPNHPWNVIRLDDKSNDPPETPKSESVFSDRYVLLQNGVPATSDCISVRFDYGSQAVGDELLDFGIFATIMNEREEQVPSQQ